MRMWSICLMLALGSASMTAQERQGAQLDGVWHVSVSVKNCETGATIREVGALNSFMRDGAMMETASNPLRGPSVGTWRRLRGHRFTSTFEFFRFNPNGTFASTARVTRTIELSEDGTQFTSVGTVEDFDAQQVRVSVGCATETAVRAQ